MNASIKTHIVAAAILLGTALPGITAAADLLQVYEDAKTHDAEYAAARASLEAGREKLPQGRALLLPTLGVTGSSSRTELDLEYKEPVTLPPEQRDFRTEGYAVTFTQPILRAQNWAQYSQSEQFVIQAEAAFGAASQNLILRVAQAYFDVLTAQDTLDLARAQKEAIAQQLEQAKHNFEAGNATITDTHEAQARYDLVSAQEIASQNDLAIRQRVLRRFTGKDYARLQPLQSQFSLVAPDMNELQKWVDQSENSSFQIVAQRAQVEIQTLELKRNRAGHYPTVDFVASYGDIDQTGSVITPIGTRARTSTIGVQLTLPLFAGGGVSSREREALALLDKTRFDFDNTRRQQTLATEQAFLNFINGVAQVRALEQALASSESAFESNKLGYQVGVRIGIDVLNAQQQVYATRRDLALARYRTILDSLQLKATVGSLQQADLEQVNSALQANSASSSQARPVNLGAMASSRIKSGS